MKLKESLKTVLLSVVVVGVFCAAMLALNLHTGPVIDKNNAGAALAPLLAVMPDGAVFDGDALIYDSSSPSASVLKGVGDNVTLIYKESSGMGFVFRCQTTTQYSKAPMELTVGVTAEGKIYGIQLNNYAESIDMREKDPGYVASYAGKDSALTDIGTVSGCTYSSTAFRNAVLQGMQALIDNDLISAGVKPLSQILTEMIPTVAPSMTKITKIDAGANIQIAYKADNDTGFAYIMGDDSASYLAVVNAMGVCRVYDVNGSDVTAEQGALADAAKSDAAAKQADYVSSLTAKIERLFSGTSDVKSVACDTFNTVAAAVTFTHNNVKYSGFYSRSFGFGQMDVYIIIDQNGAIAAMDAKTFIIDEEYFSTFAGMDTGAYKAGFVGITKDTWTGEQAIIATATMTSNAVKTSISDAFEAFDSMNGGAVNE